MVKNATINYMYFLILVTLFLVVILNQKNQKKEYSKQTELLQKRNHMDSLYIEHLKVCSFIPFNQISTDKNGYMILKK